MKTIRVKLQSKTETEVSPGQVMLQFRPEQIDGGAPFVLPMPSAEAVQFTIGNTYTVTIEESK